MADISVNIANMIQCRAGEHPLFRSYGLGGITDSPNRITRNTLQAEVARWYPAVYIKAVKVKNASKEGHFEYSIEVEGSNG